MAQNPQPSQSDSQPGKNTVLVIGAGPVGLFLSILLARANIPVIVLEAKDVLDDTPKSLAHSPVLYPDFVRAGIFEEFEEAAKDLQQITVNFRRTSDLELITTIHSVLGRPAPLIYPQNKFNRLLYRHISKYDCAQVHMGHQVLDIDNTASDRVTATVLTSSGVTKTFTASYLIGADGGRGRVRGACGIPFEGDTLRRHLIASDVRYPFEKYGWARNPNFMIDPDIAGMIGPIDAHGLWRVVFTLPGDEASITPERIKAAIPGAFEAMFPGPRPLKYTIERLAPYKAQQLCAKTFRQGRVLLIGDAAHCTYCPVPQLVPSLPVPYTEIIPNSNQPLRRPRPRLRHPRRRIPRLSL